MEEASRLYIKEIYVIEAIEVIIAMITPDPNDHLDPR
jgi:hypothetical protein